MIPIECRKCAIDSGKLNLITRGKLILIGCRKCGTDPGKLNVQSMEENLFTREMGSMELLVENSICNYIWKIWNSSWKNDFNSKWKIWNRFLENLIIGYEITREIFHVLLILIGYGKYIFHKKPLIMIILKKL